MTRSSSHAELVLDSSDHSLNFTIEHVNRIQSMNSLMRMIPAIFPAAVGQALMIDCLNSTNLTVTRKPFKPCSTAKKAEPHQYTREYNSDYDVLAFCKCTHRKTLDNEYPYFENTVQIQL